MLHLMGALVVVSAAGMVGLQVAAGYSRRPRQLSALQQSLQLLDTEIMYVATPLPEALKRAGRSGEAAVDRIFTGAAERLEQSRGWSAAEAWQTSLEQEYPRTALNLEDFQVLQAFGQGLGCSDRDEQHKRIAMTSWQLRQGEEKARRDSEKNGKIWRYGGFLLGISIALLLL